MSSSSTSSSRFPRVSSHGVPTRCWCGKSITTYGSSTAENLYRRFYRCEDAIHRKSESHLFKWIDEALIDEIQMVDAKHERVARGLGKFEKLVMENLKCEIARVEHDLIHKLKQNVNLEIASVERDMTQKLKDKVNLEIARVEKEMKQKVKITTMTMVIVGATIGIWIWIWNKLIV